MHVGVSTRLVLSHKLVPTYLLFADFVVSATYTNGE